MPKREPGLDLLRCIALLFVVTFHSFLNNGYYSESQVGISMWLAGSFRWLSKATHKGSFFTQLQQARSSHRACAIS